MRERWKTITTQVTSLLQANHNLSHLQGEAEGK